ncbi:MAG: hypothetical protein ABIS86_11990 [Streptosporangiaceae bacterium]
MNLEEATRQLQQAMHDAQVAFDCVGIGEIERAHTHVITARASLDSSELMLRQALQDMSPEEAARKGEEAVVALEGE